MASPTRRSDRLTAAPAAGPEAAPSIRRWAALCAAAETVGMTAAAAAATAANRLVDDAAGTAATTLAWTLVVAGGLVEGTALGVAQAVGLGRWLPALSRRHWVLVTVAVAGLGWGLASAPAALAGGAEDGRTAGGSGEPALGLVLAGAAALGLAMGAGLGAAQALVLRGALAHPWRWVGANAAAWPPTMVVIFLGATAPAADWPVPAVVGLGTLTGAAAGTVLGAVSGWFLPALAGPPAYNRAVLALLGSPAHRLLDRSLVGLRLRGTVTGRELALPVMYAADPAGLVVVPGRAEAKRWWRNLRRPADVAVLVHGRWRPAVGRVLESGEAGYEPARAVYLRRWPRVGLPAGAPIVLLRWPADSDRAHPDRAHPDGPPPRAGTRR